MSPTTSWVSSSGSAYRSRELPPGWRRWAWPRGRRGGRVARRLNGGRARQGKRPPGGGRFSRMGPAAIPSTESKPRSLRRIFRLRRVFPFLDPVDDRADRRLHAVCDRMTTSGDVALFRRSSRAQ
jgi:hypothetical protein